jgi:hypothetical protein
MRTRNQCQLHQYNVGAPFDRIAIDIAGPFSWSNQGNRYPLIAMDSFTKWPETDAIPNQETSAVIEALVTNSSTALECCGSYIVARAVISSLV